MVQEGGIFARLQAIIMSFPTIAAFFLQRYYSR
jgi:hypothetical protein